MSQKKIKQKSLSLLNKLDDQYKKNGSVGIVGFGNPHNVVLIIMINIITILVLLIMGVDALKTTRREELIFLTNGKNIKLGFYQLTHFLYYALLTVIFPDAWLFIWLSGVAWETIEHIYGWSVWSDVAFNTAGIAFGLLLRKIIDTVEHRTHKPFIAIGENATNKNSNTNYTKRYAIAASLSIGAILVASFLAPIPSEHVQRMKQNFKTLMQTPPPLQKTKTKNILEK